MRSSSTTSQLLSGVSAHDAQPRIPADAPVAASTLTKSTRDYSLRKLSGSLAKVITPNFVANPFGDSPGFPLEACGNDGL